MDKFVDLLGKLAEQLGTTVNNLYPLFVRQAYIDGITNIIVILIIFTLFITVSILLRNRMIKLKNEDEGIFDNYGGVNDAWGFTLIIATTLCAIVFIVSIFTIGNILTALSNPEYYALTKIFEQLQGLIGK